MTPSMALNGTDSFSYTRPREHDRLAAIDQTVEEDLRHGRLAHPRCAGDPHGRRRSGAGVLEGVSQRAELRLSTHEGGRLSAVGDGRDGTGRADALGRLETSQNVRTGRPAVRVASQELATQDVEDPRALPQRGCSVEWPRPSSCS